MRFVLILSDEGRLTIRASALIVFPNPFFEISLASIKYFHPNVGSNRPQSGYSLSQNLVPDEVTGRKWEMLLPNGDEKV